MAFKQNAKLKYTLPENFVNFTKSAAIVELIPEQLSHLIGQISTGDTMSHSMGRISLNKSEKFRFSSLFPQNKIGEIPIFTLRNCLYCFLIKDCYCFIPFFKMKISSSKSLTAQNRRNSDYFSTTVDKLWITFLRLMLRSAFHARKTAQTNKTMNCFSWTFAALAVPHIEIMIDDSVLCIKSSGKLSYQNHPPRTGEIPSHPLGGFAIRELTKSLLRFVRTCNRLRKCQQQAAPCRIARRSQRLALVRNGNLWGQGAKQARNFAAAHAFFALPQQKNYYVLKGQTL